MSNSQSNRTRPAPKSAPPDEPSQTATHCPHRSRLPRPLPLICYTATNIPDNLPLSNPTPTSPTRRPPIKRIAFLLKVKQDKIDEYKAHHRAVWPEMLDALRRTGWRNYSLFMREDGLMFGYFEADEDFAAALEGMSKEDVNERWQELMSPFFELPPGAHPDEMMLELQEVFHTD